MAAYLVANSYLGIVPEATRGTLPTGSTPVPVYIPVTSPQVTPNQTFLRDEALRGSPVMVYDQVQGVRHDEYDAKFYLFADTFGNLVKSVLGGTDTVTGTGPYTHNIKLLNNAATGSQPQSYSIQDFDGANYFTLSGAQADQLSISFGAEAAAESTIKFMANPYVSGTAPVSGSVFAANALSTSATHMIPAWDTTISVASTLYTYIQSGELTIARKTAPIFTMGAQAPYQNFAGPIEVTGKFTAVINSASDTWSTTAGGNYALTRSPQAMVITFTDPNDSTGSPSTAESIAFTMTSTQFHTVKRTRGKAYTEVEVEFTANADTTDATTGYSPIQATIINAAATPY